MLHAHEYIERKTFEHKPPIHTLFQARRGRAAAYAAYGIWHIPYKYHPTKPPQPAAGGARARGAFSGAVPPII